MYFEKAMERSFNLPITNANLSSIKYDYYYRIEIKLNWTNFCQELSSLDIYLSKLRQVDTSSIRVSSKVFNDLNFEFLILPIKEIAMQANIFELWIAWFSWIRDQEFSSQDKGLDSHYKWCSGWDGMGWTRKFWSRHRLFTHPKQGICPTHGNVSKGS